MRFFLSILLTGISLGSLAYAQEAAAPPAPAAEAERPANPHFSPVMPVKIKPRQGGADSISKAAADIEQENTVNPDSLGLLTTISTGSLGETIWKGYTSETLSDDLSKLNLNIQSPVFRALLLRALLSTPSKDLFPEDQATSKAFSSRMDLLKNLGAYDETLQLYKKLEGNIPSSSAALAGVEGMLSNSQLGLACLEEKAISPELKTAEGTSFWSDLSSFCQLLLTNESANATEDTALATVSKNYIASHQLKAPSSLSELNGKSLVEILALSKAGLISKNLFTYDNAEVLKPSVIAFLLKQSPVNAEEKISLIAAAVDKGMKPAADLQAEYVAQSQNTAAMPAGSLKDVLSAFAKVQSSISETDKAASLKSILAIKQTTLLLPFGAHFAALKSTESFTAEDAKTVLSLLIQSKNTVSGAWFAKAFNKPEVTTKESMTDLDVIAALEDNNNDMSDAEKPSKEEISDKKADDRQTIEKAQLHALSLILSSEEVEDKVKDKSYDNVFNLTGSTDYVMPSKELINNLSKAASAQDTGKVVVYSLQILNGQRASQLHPAALYRIMESLQSAGLSEEVRSLAHEVLADFIKD